MDEYRGALEQIWEILTDWETDYASDADSKALRRIEDIVMPIIEPSDDATP